MTVSAAGSTTTTASLPAAQVDVDLVRDLRGLVVRRQNLDRDARRAQRRLHLRLRSRRRSARTTGTRCRAPACGPARAAAPGGTATRCPRLPRSARPLLQPRAQPELDDGVLDAWGSLSAPPGRRIHSVAGSVCGTTISRCIDVSLSSRPAFTRRRPDGNPYDITPVRGPASIPQRGRRGSPSAAGAVVRPRRAGSEQSHQLLPVRRGGGRFARRHRRLAQRLGDVARDHAAAALRQRELAGAAVPIRAGSRGVDRREALREQRRDHARQDVTGPGGRERVRSGRVEVRRRSGSATSVVRPLSSVVTPCSATKARRRDEPLPRRRSIPFPLCARTRRRAA